MASGSHDIGTFLSAAQYWQALEKFSGSKRKIEHLDYMDFTELYGDYVAAYEKGQPDSHLNSLRMQYDIEHSGG